MGAAACPAGPLGQVRAGSCAAWAGSNLYVVGGYIGYHNPQPRREVLEVAYVHCADPSWRLTLYYSC